MRRVVVLACVLLAAPIARAQSATPPVPTIAELVARIDDDPDILHNDFTPAVWALCEHELEGAAAVLPLLDAPREDTRMHASRVLSCAVSRWYGWHPGQGFEPGTEERFRRAWEENGSYEWTAEPAARRESRERWERWIAAHRGAPPPPPDHPSGDAIRAALEPVLSQARACAPGAAHVRADVTWASSGEVTRVRVHGARGETARCIERALRGARVSRFGDPSASVAISIAR